MKLLLNSRITIGSLLKSIVPLLLPFCKTTALYFILSCHLKESKVLYSILKCAPIVTLLMFVITQSIVSRSFSNYRILVAAGLCLSCAGDIFLVYKADGYFIHGITAFGISQMIYTCAFGLRQLSGKIAAALLALNVGVYRLIYPNLNGMLAVAIPMYMLMLGCMIWSGTSQAKRFKHDLDHVCKLLPSIGSIFYLISDAVLALSLFNGITFAGCDNVIMVTYYTAQMLIALSCIDPNSI